MLNLLALLSCQALTEAGTPVIPEAKPPPVVREEPVPEVRIPAGQAIVRECWGGERERRASRSTGAPPPPPSAAQAPA
ncbi:MAG: hypothetical protein ACK4YP_27280, partial [Myxococcota bacterium]